jgi:hypothetical protein
MPWEQLLERAMLVWLIGYGLLLFWTVFEVL